MNICIVGCEHSGTRWITHRLIRHPQVKSFHHMSIPADGKNQTFKLVSSIRSGIFDAVVLVYRDRSCIEESQKKSGTFQRLIESTKKPYFISNDNYVFAADVVGNWQIASQIIMGACEHVGKKHYIFSYEAAVQNPAWSLRSLFTAMGLDPNTYDFYDYNQPLPLVKTSPEWRWLAKSWYDLQKYCRPHDGNKKYIKTLEETPNNIQTVLLDNGQISKITAGHLGSIPTLPLYKIIR